MREKWDEFSFAALLLCLGCASHTVHESAAEEGNTDELSSTTSTLTGSADTAGSGNTGTSSGGASSGSASSGSASSGSAGSGSAGSGSAGPGSVGTSVSASTGTSTSVTDGTSTAGGSGGQVSSSGNETHACLEYVLGFCEYSARCAGGLEGVIPCFEGNRASCPDVLFGLGSTRTVESSFACADAWRALTCEAIRPECATAGTLADGDACVSGIQCASRLCSGTADTCGTCLPSAELGEPCDDSLGPQCESGLVCHGTDLVCVLPTGASAGGQAIGEECDPTTSGCYPNSCRADDAAIYHCEPYPTLGEDCSEFLSCAFGDSYCDSTYVCAALPAASEPCGVDFNGIAQWCAVDLVCDGTLAPPLCLAQPALPGQGESCEGTCQTGLTCRCTDETCDSQICQWARFAGESCAAPEEACLMGECVEGACVVTEVESTFAAVCGD